MLGTDPGTTAVNKNVVGATTVLTGSLKLVLSATSPTTRVLLTALVNYGVTGFTSKTVLPAGVTGNVNIVWATDDADVKAKLLAVAGSVGFIPLVLHSSALPCAAIHVTNPLTAESEDAYPVLSATDAESLDVSVADGTISATPAKIMYPLVGPLMLTVSLPTATSMCNSTRADTVLDFVKTVLTSSTSSPHRPARMLRAGQRRDKGGHLPRRTQALRQQLRDDQDQILAVGWQRRRQSSRVSVVP